MAGAIAFYNEFDKQRSPLLSSATIRAIATNRCKVTRLASYPTSEDNLTLESADSETSCQLARLDCVVGQWQQLLSQDNQLVALFFPNLHRCALPILHLAVPVSKLL